MHSVDNTTIMLLSVVSEAVLRAHEGRGVLLYGLSLLEHSFATAQNLDSMMNVYAECYSPGCSHRDRYYESLKKVQKTRNDFSHLVGMIVTETALDVADMFHTILQFLGKPPALACYCLPAAIPQCCLAVMARLL